MGYHVGIQPVRADRRCGRNGPENRCRPIQKPELDQDKRLAFTLAPAKLVFLILTGIPILITPVVQTVLLDETAAWGVVIPIGTLTVILTGLLAWLISTVRCFEQSH